MQTVPIERYIEMVKTFGIEEAYKQRFRGTGRTVRDVMRIVTLMSEGTSLHIVADDGHSYSSCIEVLRQVFMLHEFFNISVSRSAEDIRNEHNNATLRVYTKSSNFKGIRSTEYKLHDR
ncbi:hypothetical protein EVB62_024 [Rhizobium phage RHph_TM33]|uniref:Uncharacterized protein n=1 Tax=Rhizobium phage RHph_TM33 TaxID=2509765 RepID=A0A7S5QYQ5_9CAUD|nr:hypothetical protein EVB62_024 [Rhizobium phage RHph_TM33]QIG68482.1 hypothetical protein EVB63_023 [Rhizobium phage RHph_TM38]